ncbi:MAG: C45 family autoproteolytic acyltransferase/hydrolase [Polyangiales bacterium]
MTQTRRRARRALLAVAALVAAAASARVGCNVATRITSPTVAIAPVHLDVQGDVARIGPSYLRRRGSLWEMGLSGDAVARGQALSTLLRAPMIDDERAMYEQFKHDVPFAPARWLLVDLGRVRFRHVDEGIPQDLRLELAGIAGGFQPDPFASVLPSYHRFVFLYTVYDIALSFEKSPLIGCTTFTVPPSSAGHSLLARAFDFEAGEVFDRDKVVYFVKEPGRIPFASVGWPGFVGVVSGMNVKGVSIVVHGGRAGTPRTTGIPVVFSLREVLARATTTEEAIAILSAQEVLVSHIVIVNDAKGDAAVVERAPGVPAFVRRSHAPLATTNHFEGPLASDPHDAEVRAKTSTIARRARGDALVKALPKDPSVLDLVAMLRDRKAADGSALPLGDRRAIDALIATHGVVMDATDKALWVSEYPHLLGRFVRFDLEKLLAADFDPSKDDGSVVAVPADPLDKTR